MKKNEVRVEVEKFREKTVYGKNDDDCFAPWYLHQMYSISETVAMQQSSEGSSDEGGTRGYDFGVDAFHLDASESKAKLVLVQAKYSQSLNYIVKGFRDFEKHLEQLRMLLDAIGSDVPIENKVIVNLRSALNHVDPLIRKQLNMEFVVIHLFDGDHEVFSSKTRVARESLKEAIEDSFPDRTCFVKDVGPREMGPQQMIAVASPWMTLTLNAVPVQVRVGEKATMYYGVGFLDELVELYVTRRDALFAKNVRYYINRKQNTEKGAAGKMRKTLDQICNPKYDGGEAAGLQPEIFALYHNGVTIFARDVEPNGTHIKARDPYVLNGCQTIKNAYLYVNKARNRGKINNEKWKHILVPLRILHTRDEDLTRSVTINNNRQNAITFAALRANDPVQIQLEERFRKSKIFYERQEGAYASVEDNNPEILQDEYANTRGHLVNIVELARSIAATAGEMRFAQHPSDIFEGDTAYNRIFSEKRLGSVTFLTFLQNLYDIVPVILKKDLKLAKKDSGQNGKGPRPGSLQYHVMCLLIRYLAKKRRSDIIQEYGNRLWGRDKGFRSDIKSLFSDRYSRIKRVLKERFMILKDSKSESLDSAFSKAKGVLRLTDDIDVFETFRNLDQEPEGAE